MNYTLAKKLKEVGFQQGEYRCSYDFLDESIPIEKTDITKTDNWVHRPTLSELIEACGYIKTGMDSFVLKLIPLGGGWEASASRAVCVEESDSVKTNNFNSTPESAVASLWLKLNESRGK